jgi:formate dehydrogenase subunit beta
VKELRETAKKLLEEGKVKLVIGYEQGSLPLRTSPAFIRSPEETEKLVFNSFCENNLAGYLRDSLSSLEDGEAAAVVLKGCDSRSVVCLLKEKQFKRENLVIIGVKCPGMVDWKRIRDEIAPLDVQSAEEQDGEIIVRTASSEKKYKREDYLYRNCMECERTEPVISDYVLDSGKGEVERRKKWERIREFESTSPEERWQYFLHETERCIRCYACRNACPVCYCTDCFVDSTLPYWVGTTLDISDVQMFHLVRALHTAGRCTFCGNCTQVCPMKIDIAFLVGKLCKDVEEMFSHEAGVNLEEIPPLSSFSEDDPNEGFA